MAGGKINIYGLGTAGVNVVKSPIHLDDQELTKAQNAWPDRSSGQGSIRKRDGLAAFNSVALDGAITGICPVPLPAPDIGGLGRLTDIYVVAASDGVSVPTWITGRGTDAALTAVPAGVFTLPVIAAPAPATQPVPTIHNSVSMNGRIYYPIAGDKIASFDGEREFEVTSGTFPHVPLGVYNGLLITLNGDVVTLANPSTGEQTTIGASFGGVFPTAAVAYLNEVWVCDLSGGSAAGKVKRGSLTKDLITDHTASDVNEAYMTIAAFRGVLYVGQYHNVIVANPAKIEARAVDGSWSTSFTGDDNTGTANYFTHLTVHDDQLFAFYHTYDGVSAATLRAYVFDGSSWTLDETFAVNHAVMGVLSMGSVLFVQLATFAGGNGPLLRRESNGTWTTITGGSGNAGIMGRVA